MNKDRRKQIDSCRNDLDKIKTEVEEFTSEDKDQIAEKEDNWTGRVADIRSDLESARDEEQDYYDNMPEGLKGGDKGETAQSAIDALQNAITECENLENVTEIGEFIKDFPDKFDEIEGHLEEATN
jgi:phage host-nuclease inhibitor protein Gam